MKAYFNLLIILISCLSCNGQSKFTEKKVMLIKPPTDSASYLIKGPDSILVFKLHVKYDAYWNDSIISRGTKLAKSEYHTQDALEFYTGSFINWTFQKYKATDYNIRLEYWFEYFERQK